MPIYKKTETFLLPYFDLNIIYYFYRRLGGLRCKKNTYKHAVTHDRRTHGKLDFTDQSKYQICVTYLNHKMFAKVNNIYIKC